MGTFAAAAAAVVVVAVVFAAAAVAVIVIVVAVVAAVAAAVCAAVADDKNQNTRQRIRKHPQGSQLRPCAANNNNDNILPFHFFLRTLTPSDAPKAMATNASALSRPCWQRSQT